MPDEETLRKSLGADLAEQQTQIAEPDTICTRRRK